MYALAALILGFIALSLFGLFVEHCRRQRIGKMINSWGGRLVDVKIPQDLSTRRRIIRYVGPQGELRQAVVVLKHPAHLEGDVPFQEILRQTYEPPANPSDPLDMPTLFRAAENMKLPGYEGLLCSHPRIGKWPGGLDHD